MTRRILPSVCVLFISFIFGCLPVQASNFIGHKPFYYHWGRGIDISDIHLNIGGYINITNQNNDSNDNRLALEDLSLLINWSPTDQVRFFAELEMEDWITTDQGLNRFSSAFNLERFYLDLYFPNRFTLRLGQFLTPVGLWNTTHAAPLVWTTSRPMSTKGETFSNHANGLMVKKQFLIDQHDVDVSIFFDDSADLNPRKLLQPDTYQRFPSFQWAVGSDIDATISENLILGFNYLVFKKNASENLSINHLIGIDMLWSQQNYEVQLEWIYRTASDHQQDEIAGFIQGVIPIGDQFYAIARYEMLAGTHEIEPLNFKKQTQHIFVPALAWKPASPLILKMEYRFGKNNHQDGDNGFFTSISMFF